MSRFEMRLPGRYAHRDATDVLEGHVAVLCKGIRRDRPHAVAWEESYRKADGRRYATMPGKEFYVRGFGGVHFKVLNSTFVPLKQQGRFDDA